MKRYVKAPSGLKLRTGPGTEYRELGKLPDGTAVDVLDLNPHGGPWVFVSNGGWVDGEWLTGGEEPAPAPATARYRTANALLQLLKQVNALAPHRGRSFDGTIASQQHHAQNPGSDHEPNAAGVVTAIDITHDPANGCDAKAIVRSLVASRDPRVKYLIHDGQMWRAYSKPGIPAWHPSPYTGPDPHRHHVHVSVQGEPALYDDSRVWNVSTV
jgi:uncharacterized protein YraI